MSKSSTRRFQSIALDLFAIPFLLVGTLFLTLAIFEAHKAQWGVAAFLFFLAAVPAAIGLFLLWMATGRTQDLAGGTAWLQRSDWRAGRVPYSDGGRALVRWTFWTIFSVPVTLFCYFLIPMMIRDHAYVAIAFVAIFPLVSIVLLVQALSSTRHWMTFGRSVFQMNSVPSLPGSTLSGAIQLGRQFVTNSEFQLRLVCAEHWITPGGKTVRSYEKVLWSADQLSPSDGRSVPVSFAIPNDGIPTGQVHGGHHVWWQLSATVQSNSQKYYARFEVPVFRQDAAAAPDKERLTSTGFGMNA